MKTVAAYGALAILTSALASNTRAQTAPQKIVLSSPTLKEGDAMPRQYTADGPNVSPPLVWGILPNGTRTLALVLEDPDAGNPPPFVHWVIYNIPATATGLPENVPFEPGARMPAEIASAIQGNSGFRRPFYRGPAPPPGQTASLSVRHLRSRYRHRGDRAARSCNAAGSNQGSHAWPG